MYFSTLAIVSLATMLRKFEEASEVVVEAPV